MQKSAPENQEFIVSGRKLYHFGHSSSVGAREAMEDASVIVGDFAGPGTAYFAVYDGHGGSDVAKYCANNFHRIFAQKYHETSNVISLICETINQLNKVTVKRWPSQGCTLAVLMIIRDVIYTANLGDTRIIIIDGATHKRFSLDHKASDINERKLIINKGGIVYNGRVCGVLALSRVVGDGDLNDFLIREPTVKKTKRKDGMLAIIACDGVWDVMSDEEAVKIARQSANPEQAAKSIQETAISRKTTDNVSVLVISLTKK